MLRRGQRYGRDGPHAARRWTHHFGWSVALEVRRDSCRFGGDDPVLLLPAAAVRVAIELVAGVGVVVEHVVFVACSGGLVRCDRLKIDDANARLGALLVGDELPGNIVECSVQVSRKASVDHLRK